MLMRIDTGFLSGGGCDVDVLEGRGRSPSPRFDTNPLCDSDSDASRVTAQQEPELQRER